MLKLGLNNVTNAEYHEDKSYISSSGLKKILKSPREFYKQYILMQKEEPTNRAALDFGTAAHTAILEPHLFAESVAVYEGLVRRGKAYDEFAEVNKGKIILTIGEKNKLDTMLESYNAHPHKGLLDLCEKEVTVVGELESIGLKIRADAIDVENGRILDVKTTSYATETEVFRETVDGLDYHLSAALYCTIAEQYYGKKFDFYFVVLSKNDMQCAFYKLSKEKMEVGVSKLYEALKIINKCRLTGNWEFDNLYLEIEEI